MRIAIVSPYSWTYAGGVNRHVESLAEALIDRGHEVRVLAPWDPPDRLSRVLHRAAADGRERPDYLIPLGAHRRHRRQRRGLQPLRVPLGGRDDAARADRGTLRRRPRPRAPGADAQLGCLLVQRRAGGRHLPRLLDQAGAEWDREPARRASQVQPAERPNRRLGGGRVDRTALVRRRLSRHPQRRRRRCAPRPAPSPTRTELRVLFVGRSEERKGLPVLLQAFEGLIEHVPARLTLIGATPDDVKRYVPDPATEASIEALGRVSGDDLWRRLHEADVLCAPSLAGESFGMVLTEAFAAGTPVIASEIAGYSDVVTDGVDGVLVPPADPQRLAEELQRLYLEPARREAMGRAARESAAAVRVAARRRAGRAGLRAGPSRAGARRPRSSASPGGWVWPRSTAVRDGPPSRLPSLDPAPAQAAARHRVARRVGLGVAGDARRGPVALWRRNKIGLQNVVASIVRSDAGWVADRHRADDGLDVHASRLVVRDRALGAAAAAAAPPRRDVGDDDRGPDVGDAPGSPGRARPRDGARPAHRTDAGDVPGAAGDARLADGVEHRCAGAARGDHRRPRRTSSTRAHSASSCSAWPRWCC